LCLIFISLFYYLKNQQDYTISTMSQHTSHKKIRSSSFSFTRTLKVVAVIAVMLFATQALRAGWVQPQTGPTGSDVAQPVNESGTNQVKAGKLSINGVISPSFDFLVQGAAIFQGGVRAGSGFFGGDVLVGNATPSNVSVYGDLRVLGTPGTVKNAALAHTSSSPRQVCSTATGALALCPDIITPPDPCLGAIPNGTVIFNNTNPINTSTNQAPNELTTFTIPSCVTEITTEVWGAGGSGSFNGNIPPDAGSSGIRLAASTTTLCADGGQPHRGGATTPTDYARSNGYTYVNGSFGDLSPTASNPLGADAGGPGGGIGGDMTVCSSSGGTPHCSARDGITPGGGGAADPLGTSGYERGGSSGGYGKGTISVIPGSIITVSVGGANRNPSFCTSPLYTNGSGISYCNPAINSGYGKGAAGRIKITYGSDAAPVAGFINGTPISGGSNYCPPELISGSGGSDVGGGI
jgi:hypothetical protein